VQAYKERVTCMRKVVLDIETSMDHKRITACITKDIETQEVRKWCTRNSRDLKDYLKDALVVMHNGISFDSYVLHKVWNIDPSTYTIYDTIVASRLLDPSREQGHSLESWGVALGYQKIDYSTIWEWCKGRKEAYKGESFDDPLQNLLALGT